MFQKYQKGKGTFCAAGDSDNKRTERTPHKCFRGRSEDHLIAKDPNPPKENEKRRNQLRFSEISNREPQKECENGENNHDKKIYASMARMYDNDECSRRDFGDGLQLINWIYIQEQRVI